MDETRKNRDFSKGPVWSAELGRWLIEIRYPDGSRVRKRFRREREAVRSWSAEQTKIENGTWHEQAPKTIAFETALKQYREYSTVQNRSHASYVEPRSQCGNHTSGELRCSRRLRPLSSKTSNSDEPKTWLIPLSTRISLS